MTTTPSSGETPAPLPAWMRWIGAGLTGTVAVLFVVLLLQVRQQSQRLQTLQDKVQSLENAQDLNRTDALEEQLRSMVQRLQSLEGLEQSVQSLSREQAGLRAQLRRQPRSFESSDDDSLTLPTPAPARPSRLPALPQLPGSRE